MRWSDEVTLIALSEPAAADATNANGFPVEREETATTVFGNVKSVGYSEFWKAANAGVQTELKADIYTAEHDGQRLVEIGGKRYKVLRTYMSANGEITELTLTDLPVVPQEDTEAGSSEGTEGGGDGGTV